MTKVCSRCKTDKPATDFYCREGSNQISAYCRPCDADYRRELYNDPIRGVKYRERKRKTERGRYATFLSWYTKRKYGVTIEFVKAILASQMGLCANRKCAQPISLEKSAPKTRKDMDSKGRACIDHDHETGEFRGLLCNSCNTLLGHLGRDQSLVFGLVEYQAYHSIKRS
jgi:hypothetical protein